jgi:uncharacterized repeat protein (TIGR03803 family)
MRYFVLTLALAVTLCAGRADSQTFKSLLQFSGTGGAASGLYPYQGGLTLSGTTLYGTTSQGGANGDGNVFSVGTNGSNYQNLVSLTGFTGSASGKLPSGSLILSGTTLYGTTLNGGVLGDGNIFSVGTDGTNYRNLISFNSSGGTANGLWPSGNLTLSGTTLYGTTAYAGPSRYGNIFSVGTNGTNYQNLVSFTGGGGTASGDLPSGSLILSATTLYGMTGVGGGPGWGNIFSVGTNGSNYQILVTFTGTSGTADGSGPVAGLTLSGTTFYGTTEHGGSVFNGPGNVFSVGVDGTNYRNLLSFTGTGGAAIGNLPENTLTLSGTTLYGTTYAGGTRGLGNIFSVGVNGSGYRDLYDFTGGTDGGYPEGDLTLSGGTLFGMTNGTGPVGQKISAGTVFALALPAPAPEPGTLAIVGAASAIGLVGFVWRRRAARRTAKPAAFDQQDAPAVLSMSPRWAEAKRRAA